MRRTTPSLNDRRGLTLIELLVTVFIILLITAVAIPVMAPSLEERRIRESSRLVTGFIQGARTRAIETGRPFGVMIEPLPGIRSAAVSLYYAEVQEPYGGDSVGTVAHVFVDRINGRGAITQMGPIGLNTDAGWNNRIRPGDLIKFNYQGQYYRLFAGEPYQDLNGNGIWNTGEPYAEITGNSTYNGPVAGDLDSNGYFNPASLDPSNSRVWYFISIDTANINWSAPFVPIQVDVPFQILRQPEKTAAPPLTLPEGMVIDLSGSTFGDVVLGPEPFNDDNNNGVRDGSEAYTEIVNPGNWDFGLTGPFIILFSPNGSVAGLYHSVAGAPMLTTTPIQLLIGKQDNVPATPAEGNANWRDLSNIWISIHPQTGLVTSSPVSEDATDADDVITSVFESRYYSLRAQNFGGR